LREKRKPLVSSPIIENSKEPEPEPNPFTNEVIPSMIDYERQSIKKTSNLRNPDGTNTTVNHPIMVERTPINPYLREIVEDLKKVEQYVTFGFPPPKAIIPLVEQKSSKEFYSLLEYVLKRLDNPKLADKLADFVASALQTIADKLEGRGR